MRSRSRCAPSRNSLSSICTRGRSALVPRFSRAIGTPSQISVLSSPNAKAASGAVSTTATRRGISSRSARRAARSTRRFSSPSAAGSGKKLKTVDAADGVALDDDLAAAGDRRQQLLGLARLQPAHQVRGAAVDEAAGQPLVQRVRQQVLDLARPALPVRAVLHPVAAGGDVGPHPHAGEPLHQRVDVAVRAGQRADLPGKPVGRQTLVARDVAEHPGAELGVRVVRQLAEVGDLAGLPQPPHHPPPVREAADVRLARQGGQRLQVGRVVALDQARAGRRRHQAWRAARPRA